MALEPLLRPLDLQSQPLKLALSLVLSGSLNHLPIPFDPAAREFITIETDPDSALAATLPYLALGVAISCLTTSLTDKPRIGFAEEIQSLPEFPVIELPHIPWHPALKSVCIYPLGQESSKLSEFSVITPPRASSAVAAAISNKIFLLQNALLCSLIPPNNTQGHRLSDYHRGVVNLVPSTTIELTTAGDWGT
jgi:hypothetical protein